MKSSLQKQCSILLVIHVLPRGSDHVLNKKTIQLNLCSLGLPRESRSSFMFDVFSKIIPFIWNRQSDFQC